MDAIEIAQKLISIDSVTSHSNAAIAEYQQAELAALGFEVERIAYRDAHGTEKSSLAARRLPATTAIPAGPGIAYFCHNDVVSVDGWNCPHGGPFDGVVAEGRLWGRGACDMKGPTAAALAALQRLDRQRQTAPVYLFVTGDEECGMAGAQVLTTGSEIFQDMAQAGTPGIIGEPTQLQVVNAHKGGCHFDVSSQGVAAHSSTSQGLNANWQLIPFLAYLRELHERCENDPALQNTAFDTPTLSINVVLVNEPAAFNITVGRATCRIFMRSMPATPWEEVLEEIKRTARDMELQLSSVRCLRPLHTSADRPFVRDTLQLAGQSEPQAVSFATDGCCFDMLDDLLVLGPGNIAQAHRADEWIDVSQLEQGTELYQQLFENFAFQQRT